jgi:hypothetical protein
MIGCQACQGRWGATRACHRRRRISTDRIWVVKEALEWLGHLFYMDVCEEELVSGIRETALTRCPVPVDLGDFSPVFQVPE